MEKGKESTFLLFTWSLLFIFLPLQLPIFDWKNSFLLPFWDKTLLLLTGRLIPIFSDSEGFLLIITILLILSAVVFGIFRLIWKVNFEKLHIPLRLFLMGCLFLIFAKYGLDKMMHLQFPKPEPNLMLTELGVLDKDILYWTSMGSSRLYNLVTGGLEITGAIFLLFRRTRRLGLMLLLLSTLYIVLINFSFNIGVKLFTLLLTGTLLTLNWNSIKFLFTFFLGFGEEKNQPRDKRVYLPVLKVILAASLLLFFYEMNEENRIENPMMGAYKSCCSNELAYIFINQQDYWIEEKKNGDRTSFKILGSGNKVLKVEAENGKQREIHFYEKERNQFEFISNKNDTIVLKKLNLSEVNLNQDRFNLIVR